jgi:hypothetical protein
LKADLVSTLQSITADAQSDIDELQSQFTENEAIITTGRIDPINALVTVVEETDLDQ